MAKVEILECLKNEILEKFRGESNEIFKLMKSLELNPRKGKIIGSVGGIIIKELKYKSFRFYFLTDGFKIRCLDDKNLAELLIRFVRMSDKKAQQKTIEEIRKILLTIGVKGFF
jgi:hypothetical protein